MSENDGSRIANVGYKPNKYIPKSGTSRLSRNSVAPFTRKTSKLSLDDISITPTNPRASLIRPSPIKIFSTSPSNSNDVIASKNWCFRKDCGKFENIVWFFILCTVAIVFSILAISLLAKSVRQADANLKAATPQYGKFIAESCNASTECGYDAYCSSALGTCQCLSNFYYDQYYGRCFLLKSNGESCAENRECNTEQHLICDTVNGYCTCPMQTVWASYYNKPDCVRTREIGETCQQTSHCITASYCLPSSSGQYRCQCATGYFPSYITGQCEKIRDVLERCYGFYQECPTNTVCRNPPNGDNQLYCLCITNFYYDASSKSCKAQTSNNTNCDTSTSCLSAYGLRCINGKCLCEPTKYWNGTHCDFYRFYGRPCSSVNLCTPTDPNLVCGVPPLGVSQQMCYCRTAYQFDDYSQLCVRQSLPFQACYTSNDCVDNATCLVNVCTCYPGYWFNSVTGQCDEKLAYGLACSAISAPCNYQLYGIGCYNNMCQCDPTYEYWSGTSCELRRYKDETCSATLLCRSNRGLACGGSNTCACSIGTWSASYDWCI